MSARRKGKAAKAPSSLIGQIRDDARRKENASWVEQRAKLLAAAAIAIREKGLERVTMSDIAQHFESDRASIYYYFSSKHEIYVALVEDTLAPLVEESERIADGDGTAMSKLEQIVELFMEANERHYPYLFLYTQEDMRRMPTELRRAKELKDLGDRSVGALRRVIREGQRTGELRQDIDSELILQALHGASSWTHRWFAPGGRFTGLDIGRAFCAVFATGIVTKK